MKFRSSELYRTPTLTFVCPPVASRGEDLNFRRYDVHNFRSSHLFRLAHTAALDASREVMKFRTSEVQSFRTFNNGSQRAFEPMKFQTSELPNFICSELPGCSTLGMANTQSYELPNFITSYVHTSRPLECCSPLEPQTYEHPNFRSSEVPSLLRATEKPL